MNIRKYESGNYDIIVVGAGHAGVEAALSSARLGMRVILFTINLDSVAMMPCNPSIGGTGKGHIVREIDALGGEMGVNIDKCTLQSKLLNSSKGPAAHSLRAQADKTRYHIEMKKVIESTPNLTLRQAEITEILFDNSVKKRAVGVVTSTGAIFRGKKIILATGTYLGSTVFIGDAQLRQGPNGLSASYMLSESLSKHGFDFRRYKTGTPARVDKNSLNFNKMEIQYGDSNVLPFSFMNDSISFKELPCYLTYTNLVTHSIITDNLDKSGLFTGTIEGTGPRYCPSIETKIMRFVDKDRHQLFIEPEGAETNEMYVQGMSTSMSEDVQLSFMKTIPGLENVEIMRPAYAIEYDCIDPQLLTQTLEFKNIDSLYSAGQFNGTSGYEEAAAQGLIAGINASLSVKGKSPFILDRSEAYIGVMIDDLVTKGIDEPYRMMTSKSEYRLVLRQDNADLRLTPKGIELGLVSDERKEKFLAKQSQIIEELSRVKNTKIKEEVFKPVFEKYSISLPGQSLSIEDLLKKTEIHYDDLFFDDPSKRLNKYVKEQVEITLKFAGYVEKQQAQIAKFKELENKLIPEGMNFNDVHGLRLEAREKLTIMQPPNVGVASRIPGVSPSDISVLLVSIEAYRKRNNNEQK